MESTTYDDVRAAFKPGEPPDLIVALEAHVGKVYHLGIGKSVTRSNLSKANEQRDYRIFEEFASFMIAESRRRRIQKIFELDGHVYAFDSTTIDLCLSVFEWTKFRKHKGGIKMHTLYDVEAQVPAFVYVTEAKVHDSKAMPEIQYEKGAHYIFDRGYNNFSNLYTINRIEAFFVVRAKTNVRFKPETWKRRLPENVVSDAIGYFTVYKSAKDYPEKLRKVVCIDPEDGTRYIFLTNNLTASAETIAEYTAIVGAWNCSSNGSNSTYASRSSGAPRRMQSASKSIVP